MILSKPNHIKIYGHRGARGNLPENTLESFSFLFENEINAFETDILISKDLIPVITHDFRLDINMTKDAEGNWIKDENIKIYDLTYEEILNYDVGSINKLSRYGRRFLNQKSLENQKIPKLSDIFELINSNDIKDVVLNLEIKSTPIEDNLTPSPKEMVSIIKKEIEKSNLDKKILISSFDWRILKEFSIQMPNIVRGYLSFQQNTGVKIEKTVYKNSPWLDLTLEFNEYDLPRLIKQLGGKVWCPFYRDITKKNVDMAHEEGLVVNVWTVNKENDMIQMIKYGVDAIITDYPLFLKEVCEKNNIKWF